MRQRRDRTRLAVKAVERCAILFEMRRQHLDRDVAMQPRVLGAIHLTHPADRNEVEDRVTPERRTGMEQAERLSAPSNEVREKLVTAERFAQHVLAFQRVAIFVGDEDDVRLFA